MKSTIFLAMKEYMYMYLHVHFDRIWGIKTYCAHVVVVCICLWILFEQISIIWKGIQKSIGNISPVYDTLLYLLGNIY